MSLVVRGRRLDNSEALVGGGAGMAESTNQRINEMTSDWTGGKVRCDWVRYVQPMGVRGFVH
jgi:hypothetical protein